MNPSALSSAEVAVTVGADTHKDVHVAVALHGLGGYLGTLGVPATKAGARQLISWATRLGTFGRVGVEGTGCYGAGLARFLRAAGIRVFEVVRPKR